jgi:hypothetical protein
MEVPVALQAPAAANGAAATLRAAVDQERIHRQQQFFEADRRAMKAPPAEIGTIINSLSLKSKKFLLPITPKPISAGLP